MKIIMLINEQKNLNKVVLLLLLFCVVDFIVVVASSFCLNYHLGTVFLLLILTFFAVIIPGLIVLEVLSVGCKQFITRLPLSFFWGFLLLIIVYFVSVIFDSVIIMWLYIVVMNICALVLFIKHYRVSAFERSLLLCEGINDVYLLLLFLVFLFVCILFKFVASEPVNGLNCIDLYPDYVWHMGIINTLSDSFPPVVPWGKSDMILKYHYFNDLFFAILKRMTNVSSDILLIQFSPYLNAFLISVSGYAFFLEFETGKKKAFCFTLAMVLFCATQTNFVVHYLANTNSVGISICCIMMLFAIMNSIFDNSKTDCFKSGYVLTYNILLFLLVGLKAPFALVFVAAVTATAFLIVLFRIKGLKKTLFILLVCSVVNFAVTYYFFIKKQSQGGARAFSFKLGDTLSYSDLFGVIDFDKTDSISVFLILMVVLYIALFIGVCLVPVIYYIYDSYRNLIDRNPNYSVMLLFSSMMICISIVSLSVLSFDSNNQIYFGFACIPALMLCVGIFSNNCRNTRIKRVNIIIGSLLFIVGIICVSKMCYKEVLLKNVNSYIENKSKEQVYNKYPFVFTNDEYEGMIWLKNNTKKNDFIAGDRYSLEDMRSYDINNRFCSRWFYYTAYSERRFYLEGTGYGGVKTPEERIKLFSINESLYNCKGKRNKIAKTMGVKYIVLSKRINKNKSLTEKGIKKCFNNKEISIYKVF